MDKLLHPSDAVLPTRIRSWFGTRELGAAACHKATDKDGENLATGFYDPLFLKYWGELVGRGRETIRRILDLDSVYISSVGYGVRAGARTCRHLRIRRRSLISGWRRFSDAVADEF